MTLRNAALRAGQLLLFAGWAALAFWTFSWSYSSSFFEHNLVARLPPFVAALLGALALPSSAIFFWRRTRLGRTSRFRAWLGHCVGAGLSLVPLLVVATLQAQAPRSWRPSADDAMGTGIDFLILAAAAIASCALLGLVLGLQALASSRRSG